MSNMNLKNFILKIFTSGWFDSPQEYLLFPINFIIDNMLVDSRMICLYFIHTFLTRKKNCTIYGEWFDTVNEFVRLFITISFIDTIFVYYPIQVFERIYKHVLFIHNNVFNVLGLV